MRIDDLLERKDFRDDRLQLAARQPVQDVLFPLRHPLGVANHLEQRVAAKVSPFLSTPRTAGKASPSGPAAAVLELEEHLLPHAEALAIAIAAKANEWNDVVKMGGRICRMPCH